MSVNQQIAERPAGQRARRAQSAAAGAVIVMGAFVATLVVVGLCAGLAFVGYPAARDAVSKKGRLSPALGDRLMVNERWVQRVLSEVYTGAVDKVVTDESVIEKLGEPVETDVSAKELFRRDGKGDFSAKGEAIEFDVVGPKGRGTVRVLVIGGDARLVQVREITVTPQDGSTINVELPSKWNVRLR